MPLNTNGSITITGNTSITVPSNNSSTIWVDPNKNLISSPYITDIPNTYGRVYTHDQYRYYNELKILKESWMDLPIIIGRNFITVLPPRIESSEGQEKTLAEKVQDIVNSNNIPSTNNGIHIPSPSWTDQTSVYGPGQGGYTHYPAVIKPYTDPKELILDGQKLGLENIEYISDIPEGYEKIVLENFPCLKELPRFPKSLKRLQLKNLPECIGEIEGELITLELYDLPLITSIEKVKFSCSFGDFCLNVTRLPLIKALPEFPKMDDDKIYFWPRLTIVDAPGLTQEYIDYHNLKHHENHRIIELDGTKYTQGYTELYGGDAGVTRPSGPNGISDLQRKGYERGGS